MEKRSALGDSVDGVLVFSRQDWRFEKAWHGIIEAIYDIKLINKCAWNLPQGPQ